MGQIISQLRQIVWLQIVFFLSSHDVQLSTKSQTNAQKVFQNEKVFQDERKRKKNFFRKWYYARNWFILFKNWNICRRLSSAICCKIWRNKDANPIKTLPAAMNGVVVCVSWVWLWHKKKCVHKTFQFFSQRFVWIKQRKVIREHTRKVKSESNIKLAMRRLCVMWKTCRHDNNEMRLRKSLFLFDH